MSKTTNIFHVAGNYIAEQHIDIHDNQQVFVGNERPQNDSVQASGEVKVERYERAAAPHEPAKLCPYLVIDKIIEMGIATPEQAEAELRAESEKDAKHFAAYLRKKEKAGMLHFHGDTKKQILATLQAHFPNMKRYTYNNFIYYF